MNECLSITCPHPQSEDGAGTHLHLIVQLHGDPCSLTMLREETRRWSSGPSPVLLQVNTSAGSQTLILTVLPV